MSRYGKRLLKQIELQYCNHTPASRGVREYLEQHLQQFKAAHPHVSVQVQLKRNSFPLVRATYVHPHFAARSNTGAEQQQQQQDQKLWITAAVRAALKEGATPDPTTASKTVDLKYKSLLEVRQHMWWLSSGQGRPTKHTVPNKHWVSKQPSIQGPWTPRA